MVVLAALAVADGDVGAAELGQEGTADLTGVGAGVVHREVLGAVLELEPVAVDERLHAADVGERRQHRDLDGAEVVLAVLEGPVELLHEVGGLEVVQVHLPVPRHEGGAARGHGCSRCGPCGQDGDAGQFLALEVLEGRAATGGDVAELVVAEAELAHRGGGVATTDDGQGALLGDLDEGLREPAGAGGERLHLERAHRAVPEDRAGVGELLGVELAPTSGRCPAPSCRRGWRRPRP